MTITFHTDLVQGSDEWLQARCGLLTASTIGKLITPATLKVANNDTSRDLIRTLAAERITGHVDYVHPSFDMQRGTNDEPYARDLYREMYGPVEEVGFVTREVGGHTIGASPDGLVGTDGGIEIKSRKPTHQLKAFMAQSMPLENVAQVQALMFVLDRSWWDYVSYAGGLPLFVKRVYPDPAWQTVIGQALEQFELEVNAIVDTFRREHGNDTIAPRIDHYADTEIRI